MALLAYLGQSGPDPEASNRGGIEGESIKVREVGGLRLDYRLVRGPAPETAGTAPAPSELVLYIAGEELGGELEAMVRFLVTGPRGSQLKALALPNAGRYAADIYLADPGIYRIVTEIQTPRGTIRDVFEHAVS